MRKLFMPRAPAIVRRDEGVYLGRSRTRDVAFTYRMGAGFAGDVNRTHPFSVEPCLIDAAAPPLGYGLAVLVDPTTNGVRQMAAGDSGGTYIYGVTVRPYPTQQQSGGMSSAFGSVAPPVSGVIDVAKIAYIMVPIVNTGGTPAAKGGAVFVWVAASGGGHLQGGFETAATGGSTIALPNYMATFNGPADASGIGELVFGD
jgi:hypothetical protein